MIRLRSRLGQKGSMAVEFALTVPVLMSLVLGMVQGGVLLIASAGLKHGVGEAARVSTLWPARTDAEIKAELQAKTFGVNKSNLADPVITRGTALGAPYTEITATYVVPMNLYIISLPSVTLTESRRAYIP